MEKGMQPEDRAAELHFQLANVDRRRMIAELEKEDLHLNELARRVGVGATEAYRHVQRMTDARVLERRPDGRYRLTPYAKLVLDLSLPLDFVSRYRDSLMENDALLLPKEYRGRLGELLGGEQVTDDTEVYNRAAEMQRTAEERIDATVSGNRPLLEITLQRLKAGVRVRWLMKETFLEGARAMLHAAKNRPETRYARGFPVNIVLTENTACVIFLPSRSGVASWALFGKDPSFVKWTGDLFEYEWQKARIWYP
jgi:predicted transcriptional regulator